MSDVPKGMNGRLDSIQAAVLLAKMTVFTDELATQRSNSAITGRRELQIGSNRVGPWKN